jgi:gamma-glutamylputrescine oxidase
VAARAVPSSPVPKQARFAIIGAGMTGLATAYELTLAGAAREDIVVLDAVGPAFGATGRNAGFVLSFPGTEILDWEEAFGAEGVHQLAQLNRLNRDTTLAFIEEWNAAHPREAILLQRGGSLYLTESAEEDALLDRAHALIAEGVEDQFSLGAPTGRLAARLYRRALVGKRDAGINPCAYALALAASARVRMCLGQHAVVVDMTVRDEAVDLTLADGASLRADQVFIATNGYARVLLGDEWPVKPVRNQVLLVRPDAFDARAEWKDAIHYANHGFDYWRVLPDGRLIVGGGRNHAPGREEDILDLAPQAESIAYLRDTLVTRLLDGDSFTVEHQWSGVMGFSPDGVPFLGAVPSTGDRVRFAGGFTGYGLGFHRVVAMAAARVLTGGGEAGIFDAARLSIFQEAAR